MITFDYYMHVWGKHFVHIMESKSNRKPSKQMVDRILELEERTKIQILAPLVSHRKGSHEKLIEDIGKRICQITCRW